MKYRSPGARHRRVAVAPGQDRVRCASVLSNARRSCPPSVSESDATKVKDMDMKTSPRLKVYKRVHRSMVPMISDEIIFEILVRLPVKDLMRFKSVSKVWRAMISDPLFIRLHLQQSAKNQKQIPSFLITPHTLFKVIDSEAWPSTFSSYIPFYSWQEGQDNACLLHSTNFQGEFASVYPMVHCDGLVVLPTNTQVYVFNPATHDVLKLHNGQKDEWSFPTIGLGLDARTSKYKVARFFYRSLNFKKWAYSVGMEMFTIGGGDDINSCWSTMEDPPFPIRPGAVTYFKGSLYLHIWSKLVEVPPQGFLRFNFEDETFSFICHPRLLQSKEEQLNLIELGGELCLAQCLDEQIVVWMLRSDDGHEWVRQYVISLPEALYFQAFFVLPKDIMLLRSGHCLYHYVDAYAREMVCLDRLRYKNSRVGSFDFVGQDIFFFDIFPYTESLVPVTNGR